MSKSVDLPSSQQSKELWKNAVGNSVQASGVESKRVELSDTGVEQGLENLNKVQAQPLFFIGP